MEDYEKNIIDNITADAEDEIWKLKKIVRETADLPEDIRNEIMQEIRRAEQEVRTAIVPKEREKRKNPRDSEDL